MPSISQLFAASYDKAVNAKNKAADQWSESAFLRELERQGSIKKTDLGKQITVTLNYQRNTGAEIQATDLQPVSLAKTEVLTEAQYAVASISVPVTWSKKDEAMNGSDSQKVDLVESLITNAFSSHDDVLEQTLLGTTSNGLIGIRSMVSEDGTGTIGGIDAGTDVFWKNQFDEYTDGNDIDASMTQVWNACTKGSGSPMTPSWCVSDAATQAVFEASQQSNQRYVDTQDLKAGFTTLAFKTARYVFSRYGTDSIFFGSPKTFQIVCSRSFFRQRGKTQEIDNAQGYRVLLFSALQVITSNRSRLGVSFT